MVVAQGAQIIIGRKGESNATTLTFTVPSTGDIYLDWQLPNGLITQTTKLTNGEFVVPGDFLTVAGLGRCDVIKRLNGTKSIIDQHTVRVEEAIAANELFQPQHVDIMDDHEQRIDTLEGMAFSFSSKFAILTQAEYNALPSTKSSDGKLYFITEG